ncbi:MAG: hypothetical protein H6855_01495 [Rhodospirillales bacterium]|nr:hypothetical protein [Rhodospirillales bacterium]MCB9964744.1 hypothetical protein [Rhodospirillales bacterium]
MRETHKPPLGTLMRCGLLTDEGGKALLMHDQEIPTPDWIEFDEVENKLYLVYEHGVIQDTGLEIDTLTTDNLFETNEITFVHYIEGKAEAQQKVTLVFKEI